MLFAMFDISLKHRPEYLLDSSKYGEKWRVFNGYCRHMHSKNLVKYS